ncbi:MAG: glycerophosphodiester phosphodiesterase [Clostridia bacterium]|nr:glycerophosphodiester phosphodiesterase [Clostridia bacterium]
MVKVIAHRGANKLAPQNTLPAFRLARELGCDGFENDTHFTKDRQVVVCHNYDIDKTSNGKGFIKDMTLDELRSYDFGSYFSPEYAGTRIPTLDEFFEVAKGLEIINVEIKRPIDGDLSIVDATIEGAKKWGVLENLLISSFDPACLDRAAEYEPACKTAVLYDMTKPEFYTIIDDPAGFASKHGCFAIHPIYVTVDRHTVERAHELGLKVNPWTVDSDEAILAMAYLGCDGVITDVCGRATELLRPFNESVKNG